MAAKAVVAHVKYVQDLRDEILITSPKKFGGGIDVGDQVAVYSEQTGNLLALGEVVDGGKPYAEHRNIKVTKRFA